jgi:hypothetical protein
MRATDTVFHVCNVDYWDGLCAELEGVKKEAA